MVQGSNDGCEGVSAGAFGYDLGEGRKRRNEAFGCCDASLRSRAERYDDVGERYERCAFVVDHRDDDRPGLSRHLGGRKQIGALTRLRHDDRSEEHTSELQSLMRISYAVFCLTKKQKINTTNN